MPENKRAEDTVDIYIDAACRGNPGESSYALIAILPDGTRVQRSNQLGKMTNQESEFTALQRALELAVEKKWAHIQVYTDARLVQKAATGQWKIKSHQLIKKIREIAPLAQQIKLMDNQRGQVDVDWRPREDPVMKEVDELCNIALNPKYL
jgi:ribonuclease HI